VGKKKGTQVKVGYDLQKLTLDVLATCIFGVEFDTLNGGIAEPLTAYNYITEYAFNPLRMIFPWINDLPLPGNIKYSNYLNYFYKFCGDIMEQTKKRFEEKKIRLNDESNSAMNGDQPISLIELMYESGVSEDVIRDNLSLFFLAGHETTSSTLCWTMALLVSHPDVLEKARKEVLERVPDQLTPENLKDLPYLDGLIKECLRLQPPSILVHNRFTQKETLIGNIKLPPGTETSVDLLSMAFHPVWGDPHCLRPERWFSENLTKDQRSAWLPFATGPRVCIGMSFSLLEQKIFLALLLKRFKIIKLAPNGIIERRFRVFPNIPNIDKLIIQFVS